ncbi:MAG TPA: DUF4097 family beta strand repeat-containing protein [Pyrinomonadaceae bacterium]|jgi:hypothetical protein|nr:DUF4097 family beta strand repeat-containing protein [Pyrinomonadaceae bacterium]
MANESTTQNTTRSGQNRILILLLLFAVVSSAGKDLGRLHLLTKSIYGAATSWIGSTVYASEVAPAPASCPNALAQNEKTEDFHWVGQLASGQAIEIRGTNGGISAEPARGGDVEVFAVKKGRRSEPSSVAIKVVPHPGGVTICAVYPSDNPDNPNSCEPDRTAFNASNNEPSKEHRDGSATFNVQHNDVSVDFKIRVPTGVAFIGRTINGEISARSLTGNVDSRTVNGSVDISTSGYARARTVNGEISARMGRADWADSLDFKTINGGIDLDFPSSLNTAIEAETFNGDIESDFPLTVKTKVSRKHMSGTIGSGGRMLLLKTLNGSIRVRRLG